MTKRSKAVEPRQSGVLDCIISELLFVGIYILYNILVPFFSPLNVTSTKAVATADISCFSCTDWDFCLICMKSALCRL